MSVFGDNAPTLGSSGSLFGNPAGGAADGGGDSAADAALDAGADEAAGNAQKFEPVAQVKAVVVKTMEEDEHVCFLARAKLFRFVAEDEYGGETRSNMWKERGTGNVKLLRHKEFGKVRVVMRQDKTLKVCLNHLVSPGVELAPNVGSDRAWLFTAADFADGEVKTGTFALKFRTPEDATKYKEGIELAKKINKGDAEPDTLPPVPEDDEDTPKPPAAPSAETADLDKKIDERNAREQVRRDSVRAQSAQEDSDHDSQTEDVNEGGEARLKATVGDPTTGLAQGLGQVSLEGGKALCGGFQEAAVDDPTVLEAAEFAAGSLGKGKLAKVAEAAQQVVAGMNFRLVLHIQPEGNEELHAYLVQVFKPLPHTSAPMELKESTFQGAVSA